MGKTPWTEGPYLISGHVVYALEDFHDRRGRYEQRNRITIQVDGGPDTPKEEVEAVKTLLAASPEMAEALADFVAMGEQYGWDKATTGRDILMRNARAALSKARGNQ